VLITASNDKFLVNMGLKITVIRDERYLDHKTGLLHPENPDRLRIIYRMLDTYFSQGLVYLPSEPATMEQLELVHSPSYVQKVLKTAGLAFTHLAPDTPASPMSYFAAFLAVGGCLKALDSLLSGQCEASFALVRPPGHHAMPDRATGFCIFNNLGITARYGMNKYGLERILVVDWDIHHGQGLQGLFYDTGKVLYFSSHYMGFYPQTGAWTDTGTGEGLGYTVNIPLPKEVGDKDIIHLYSEVLGPIIRRYRPELIMVAAGFDAHHLDRMGGTNLTEKAFGCLTHMLVGLRAEVGYPPLLFALEGGYHLEALALSVKEVLKALTSDDRDERCITARTKLAEDLVREARKVHAQYGVWADTT
jgi:acetoin utilization deacetylase AcuC-like enzyme